MFRRAVVKFSKKAFREELQFSNTHGFSIEKIHRVDDLNLVAYQMIHNATKAPYFHVDTDDSNNTFCIGFRTPAENSKGASHVLEHTVLCGSKKHPIRDPFFLMLRRSLSTFMNALTGADYTLYPFSTTNERDYQNLLSVYLDAVFKPLLRKEDFQQEGHRIEAPGAKEMLDASPASDGGAAVHTDNKKVDDVKKKSSEEESIRLAHNGVVFNEMRGVASDPNSHFYRRVLQVMLPGTHYQHFSGGDPREILTLTYEELLAFHRRYYSPSNSVTFSYGSFDPTSHMKALNEYFSMFPPSTPVRVPTLVEQQRFKEPRTIREDGPLDVMGNPKLQKRILVSYGIPETRNSLKDVVALSVLDDLLCMGPGSPMFKTLIESHIGAKYSSMKGYISYLSSPIISYGVSGVDEDRENAEEEVEKAVNAALEVVQKEGFDERRVRSVIFQQELQQRHRSTSFGLNLCTSLCALALCRVHTNPVEYINWLPHLKQIGKDNARELLPLIKTIFTDNSHRALISVSAKKEFLEESRRQLQQLDENVNAETPLEEKKKILESTKKWLERVRQKQNSDVLPTLHISDIPKESFREPLPDFSTVCPQVSTISYPTNGLVYVHGAIPHEATISHAMAVGERWSLPIYFPQLINMVGRTGAGKFSFRELSTEVQLVCSGFSFAPMLNESYTSKGTVLSGTAFGFYTTVEKLEESLNLLRMTFLQPRSSYCDPDVVSRTLSRSKMACSQSIQSLQSSGHTIAVSSASSRLSRHAAIYERWWGLEKTRYCSTLLEKLQGNDEDARQEMLSQLVHEYDHLTKCLVASMRSGLLWATCEKEDQRRVEQALVNFRNSFPADNERRSTSSCDSSALHIVLPKITPDVSSPRKVNRECLPIDTSYVGVAMQNDLSWDSFPDHAALRVGCQLLDNEYTHRRVREEGGAYGASVRPSLMGEVGGVSMSSYRDPTPEKTLIAFDEARDWLADPANITQERVDEAKLRLFSKIDSPYTADSFGCVYFYNDVKHELKQQLRDALLSITPAQIVDAAKYLDTSRSVVTFLQPETTSEEVK